MKRELKESSGKHMYDQNGNIFFFFSLFYVNEFEDATIFDLG